MNERPVREEDSSIKALLAFLQEIAATPERFVNDLPLTIALRSQGALAKLSVPDKKIIGTSINTVKRQAEKEITGGFRALDVARNLALEKIEGAKVLQTRTRRRTKQALTEEIRRMEQKAGQSASDNMLLTGAIGAAIVLMREYAEKTKDGAIIADCEKEIRDLLIRFSLKNQNIFGTKPGKNNGTEG